jgi:uncharacterized linocin/CFP29 family protein
MDLGRDKLPWSRETWNRIDQAVMAEVNRSSTTRKILPLFGPVEEATTSVPADIFDPNTGAIDEGRTTALLEISSEFLLTMQQVAAQDSAGSATTAATARANRIALAEDLLVMQGRGGGGVVALPAGVAITSGQVGAGLLNSANAPAVPIDRPQAGGKGGGGPLPYGESMVAGVNQAIGALQQRGHFGPYALILSTALFAEAHTPLGGTLVMPSDRIKPVVTAGFLSSPSLPPDRGLLVSLGGNSMDIVRSSDVATAFNQVDGQGRYRFRVFERFALRLKRDDAVAKLEFN